MLVELLDELDVDEPELDELEEDELLDEELLPFGQVVPPGSQPMPKLAVWQ